MASVLDNGDARRATAAADAFLARLPFLGDRETRFALYGKLVVPLLHAGMVLVAVPSLVTFSKYSHFGFWYIAFYVALVFATLFQYFYTSLSSPGYVLDAMRLRLAAHATPEKTHNLNQSQSEENGEHLNTAIDINNGWSADMAELHRSESASRHWTCHHCNILQPPRSRHCLYCGQCVLQYDHHCIALGQCIGKGNHSKFWWFLLEEVTLLVWTELLQISFMRSRILQWWMAAAVSVVIVLQGAAILFVTSLLIFHSYLALTSQTTYEVLRRQRLPYTKDLPRKVRPFSRGFFRNIWTFCCSCGDTYTLEALPPREDLEAASSPYSFLDIVSCTRFWTL